MDPATGVARDGSRLNQVILIRLDPATLDADTAARAADGIVAYSGIWRRADPRSPRRRHLGLRPGRVTMPMSAVSGSAGSRRGPCITHSGRSPDPQGVALAIHSIATTAG